LAFRFDLTFWWWPRKHPDETFWFPTALIVGAPRLKVQLHSGGLPFSLGVQLSGRRYTTTRMRLRDIRAGGTTAFRLQARWYVLILSEHVDPRQDAEHKFLGWSGGGSW
jgi:hypothetical protein